MNRKTWSVLFALFVTSCFVSRADPLGTAFTYQGQLNTGGSPANGSYDLTFELFDASAGGNVVASPATKTAVAVHSGLFTVTLDFGASAFDGEARWLEMAARTNGVGGYTTLAPRQSVPLMPYALYAGSAGSASNLSSGTWNASVGTYQGYSNVFGIFANGSLMLGMSTKGMMITADLDVEGGLTADQISVGNSVSADTVSASSSIGVVGTNGWAANMDSGGNISASGNLTAYNANITSGTLALGPFPTWSLIYSDGNGGLSVEGNGIGESAMDPSGISTTGEINVNGGTVIINPNGDIHANWFNGLGVNATIGCSAPYFNTTSDRNVKEKFAPVDAAQVLERVTRLPITTWDFTNAPATRHLGPMAQDFYAAFNVGTDDKHIATVDEGGVALAAIQGLNQKVDEQRAALQAKDTEIQALRQRLEKLERLVTQSPQAR